MNNKEKVYEHQEPQWSKQRPARVTPFVADIEAHVERTFPERKHVVFPEKVSEFVQVDIHLLEALTPQDVHVLYTVGMSALPMELPEEYRDKLQGLERAELLLFLPPEWKLAPPVEGEVENNSVWWPVNLMKYLAKFPHEYNTWLGGGHIVPNSKGYEPYDETTKLCGAMLGALQEEVSVFHAKDGTQLNLYTVVPLYQEEILKERAEGLEALLGSLSAINGFGMTIFPDRPNVGMTEE